MALIFIPRKSTMTDATEKSVGKRLKVERGIKSTDMTIIQRNGIRY